MLHRLAAEPLPEVLQRLTAQLQQKDAMIAELAATAEERLQLIQRLDAEATRTGKHSFVNGGEAVQVSWAGSSNRSTGAADGRRRAPVHAELASLQGLAEVAEQVGQRTTSASTGQARAGMA